MAKAPIGRNLQGYQALAPFLLLIRFGSDIAQEIATEMSE
jgi:hypothetical protein